MNNKDKFDSIKKESVRSIFEAIAARQSISRAEIAAQVGLSLMTVGKVVDVLLDRKIVVQVKENRQAAGRRAGLVSLNRAYFSLVLDLTRKQFRLSVVDASMETIDRMDYDYNPEYYYEENLYIFLKNVKIYILRHCNMSLCMGIGALVPGVYDKESDCVRGVRVPELASISLTQVIEDILKEKVSVICDDVGAAALSNTMHLPQYAGKTVFYVSLGDSVCGAILQNGRQLFAPNGGNLGETTTRGGKRLSDTLGTVTLSSEQFAELSVALYNLIWIINPDAIIIENRKVLQNGELGEMLELAFQKLLGKREAAMPAVIIADPAVHHAETGIATSLRSTWLASSVCS